MKSMKLFLLGLMWVTTSAYAVPTHTPTVPQGNTFAFGHNRGNHVPAVPEADTWAMMAVGLGLIGMRLRTRKTNKGI